MDFKISNVQTEKISVLNKIAKQKGYVSANQFIKYVIEEIINEDIKKKNATTDKEIILLEVLERNTFIMNQLHQLIIRKMEDNEP